MSAQLTKNETELLALLRAALNEESVSPEKPDPEEWSRICAVADRHEVLPLLLPVSVGQSGERLCRAASERCALRFYHLLILTRRFVGLLRENGIDTVVLKGPGAAWYYPVPEHRQSGDIDLLLIRPGQLDEACRILEEDGAVTEEKQHANHHRNLRSQEGVVVELHSSPVEDFDDAKTNALLAGMQGKMAENAVRREVVTGAELPVPDDPEQAISLLTHMLQHFLRAGFGLKLLCDWTVLWNRLPEEADMNRYELFLDESGLRGFADMIGSVCIRYLGLSSEKIRLSEKFEEKACTEFMREIFDAEAFGHTSAQRMVIVRGGPAGYLREFHHQMHLNFPNAGRWIPLWPALWSVTLALFLRNNRVVRKTSLADILSETGRRSRLTEPMHLFRR